MFPHAVAPCRTASGRSLGELRHVRQITQAAHQVFRRHHAGRGHAHPGGGQLMGDPRIAGVEQIKLPVRRVEIAVPIKAAGDGLGATACGTVEAGVDVRDQALERNRASSVKPAPRPRGRPPAAVL